MNSLRERLYDSYASTHAGFKVDASPEQVRIASLASSDRVDLADFHGCLRACPSHWNAIIATDVLEHLGKPDVLRTFDDVREALAPGGVFIARAPNAASPLGGGVMYGDITHETWFTARSVAQLAAVTGFARVRSFPCPPVQHGIASAARALIWKSLSGLVKLALAAETGQLRGHIVTQIFTFVASRGVTRQRGARPDVASAGEPL